MKKSDLKALINECIHEVLAEETADKKTKAINEIKRIIAENELEEADLAEVGVVNEALPKFFTTIMSKLGGKPIIPSAYKFKNPKNAEGSPNPNIIKSITSVNPNLTPEEATTIGRILIDMDEAGSVVNSNKWVIANPEIDSKTGPGAFKLIGAVGAMNPNPAG